MVLAIVDHYHEIVWGAAAHDSTAGGQSTQYHATHAPTAVTIAAALPTSSVSGVADGRAFSSSDRRLLIRQSSW
jgi:hypothetical protein